MKGAVCVCALCRVCCDGGRRGVHKNVSSNFGQRFSREHERKGVGERAHAPIDIASRHKGKKQMQKKK